MKPENVLVFADGDGQIAFKIADLGIAKYCDPDGFARSYIGAVFYRSPEATELGVFMPVTDVYSLGKMVVEVVPRGRNSLL